MSVIQFSFRFCYTVLFFLTPADLLYFFAPADPQLCTSDLVLEETSVPLPPTQSEPFEPMNFQFPKTQVGKQSRSFDAKWVQGVSLASLCCR